MLWKGLPQPSWCYPCREKPGATVLVRAGAVPVLATQFYGAGTSVFIGADEFWRWRLSAEDLYFHRLYGEIIRFASRRHILGSGGNWRLALDRRRYFPGERVRFEVSPRGASTRGVLRAGMTPEAELLSLDGSTRALQVSQRTPLSMARENPT